jgi:D-arginine dehydrogenase
MSAHTPPVVDCEVAIVGGGIAGASLAWRVAGRGRVLLVEREAQPGMHSTGRSAAMFMQTYGPAQVRALTRASRAFYGDPPEGFTPTAVLAPRGALYVARAGQEALIDASLAQLRGAGAGVEWLDADAALARVPVLRRDGLLGAICEGDAMDIDVHALHQGYLRGARRRGALLWTDAELAAARCDAGGWSLTFADGRTARAQKLVNAAGAWADDVAQRAGVAPLGLQPRRRSAFTFDPPSGIDGRAWPAVVGVAEDWYFKPDAGQLLGSPANADPVAAHDVAAEEIDIATGIARIEAATTLTIRRPRRVWAGLRTFAADGELVVGADANQPAFFWLAGQGGYGIQSAAGVAELAESLLFAQALPRRLADEGVDPGVVAPARFGAA